MISGSLALNGSALLFESTDSNLHLHPLKSSPTTSSSSSSKRFNSIVSCNSNNNNINASKSSSSSNHHHHHEYNIPKLEPFSRSKFERGVKDPPLIQQSEAQLADYCSTLEGETSYSCWQAYFELKDLEKETAKEEVEKLIIEAGGVKSLIGCLHGVAAIRKANKEANKQVSKGNDDESKLPSARGGDERKMATHHIPDGLPKTAQEMEEEEKARMPDSPLTRMLRMRGKHPAWYSPAPDHETD